MNDQALDSSPATDIRALGVDARPRGVGTMVRILSLCFLVALTTGLNNCNSETLFKSNFDANAINQPPAQSQAVGTVTVEGGVVVATFPDLPSVKGVRLDPLTNPSDTVLHCNLVQHPANGTYVFSTALYFPSKTSGILTISFDRAPGIISPATESKAATVGPQRFMHLDFLGNSVRIDDDNSTTFGKFPRDQVFIVQVTIKLDASPSAHIVLSGAGASGEADRNLQPGTHPVALDFGAVRISTVLTADEQTFYATNILVHRKL